MSDRGSNPSPTVKSANAGPGGVTRCVTALPRPPDFRNMDWPHDPDGELGSEGRRKYGHAVLSKKVDEGADFPLSRDAYVERYGDHPVRLDDDRVVSVADIFEGVDVEEFEDFVGFHQAVGRAMREHGHWTYEGPGEA